MAGSLSKSLRDVCGKELIEECKIKKKGKIYSYSFCMSFRKFKKVSVTIVLLTKEKWRIIFLIILSFSFYKWYSSPFPSVWESDIPLLYKPPVSGLWLHSSVPDKYSTPRTKLILLESKLVLEIPLHVVNALLKSNQ